jgi:hypothetical protein
MDISPTVLLDYLPPNDFAEIAILNMDFYKGFVKYMKNEVELCASWIFTKSMEYEMDKWVVQTEEDGWQNSSYQYYDSLNNQWMVLIKERLEYDKRLSGVLRVLWHISSKDVLKAYEIYMENDYKQFEYPEGTVLRVNGYWEDILMNDSILDYEGNIWDENRLEYIMNMDIKETEQKYPITYSNKNN